jgi:quaternary ammonium compound-resistance protein SugE
MRRFTFDDLGLARARYLTQRKDKSMAWLAVITAGLLEVGFATMLKLSNGFTKLWPSLGFIVFAAGSFSLLSWSLKVLPIGTAYAVWTGIGAAGTAILGMIIFKDPVSIARITAIAFIIAGVILLNFSSSSH